MKRREPWLTSESNFGMRWRVPNPPFNSKLSTAGALFFGALGRENAKNGWNGVFRWAPPLGLVKDRPTIDQRLQFLRNQKRCFRCFKKGHVSQVLLLEEASFAVQ